MACTSLPSLYYSHHTAYRNADYGCGVEDLVLPIADSPLKIRYFHRVQTSVGDRADVGEELQRGVHDHLISGSAVQTGVPLRPGDSLNERNSPLQTYHEISKEPSQLEPEHPRFTNLLSESREDLLGQKAHGV